MCGVGVGAAQQVEGVDAGAEVGAVDELDEVVDLVPMVGVGGPGEGLVGEADGRVGRGADLCGGAQVGDDVGEGGGGLGRGEVGGRDLDEVGVEGVGEANPEMEFVDALGVGGAGEEAFVVGKGLQADDVEVVVEAGEPT